MLNPTKIARHSDTVNDDMQEVS